MRLFRVLIVQARHLWHSFCLRLFAENIPGVRQLPRPLGNLQRKPEQNPVKSGEDMIAPACLCGFSRLVATRMLSWFDWFCLQRSNSTSDGPSITREEFLDIGVRGWYRLQVVGRSCETGRGARSPAVGVRARYEGTSALNWLPTSTAGVIGVSWATDCEQREVRHPASRRHQDRSRHGDSIKSLWLEPILRATNWTACKV